ncbi:MAG: aminopeptidase family protein P, partial [Longicatena sp.]
EGVPTIAQYIYDHMKEKEVFGFDGRVMNTKLTKAILGKLKEKEVGVSYDEDLVDMIWKDRPTLPKAKAFFLTEAFSGKSVGDKLKEIREEMNQKHATHHIITSLDDIAWILNMRGGDVECYPVALSYLVLTHNENYLFIDADKLTNELYQEFKANNIVVKDYDAIYDFVKTIEEGSTILLDSGFVNYAITQNLKDNIKLVDCTNPSQMMKAIKNPVELENNKIAHIRDGVAMTKFMYWLKTNVGKMEMSEISASDYLRELRAQQENFLDVSFDTISAYKEHAAMMHYSATAESDVMLQPEGLLLVDSGGQYLEGTTDITRTFVLGPISDEIRLHFTAALRGHIALSRARFLHGCRGVNLDILARGPLWDMDLDYKCGTGHGVGHLLNVHEGPNGFRWKIVSDRSDSCILEEGMTQSNEPGVYVEGSHGIRHENECVVRKGEKNEYGQYMYLETITFVPFDLDGIDTELLTQYEIYWLNEYHEAVYNKISPYLNDAEKEWLKEATRAI